MVQMEMLLSQGHCILMAFLHNCQVIAGPPTIVSMCQQLDKGEE